MSNQQRGPYAVEPGESSRLLAKLKEKCARHQQTIQRLETEKSAMPKSLPPCRQNSRSISTS